MIHAHSRRLLRAPSGLSDKDRGGNRTPGGKLVYELGVTRPHWIVTRRVNLGVRTRQMAERPISFAQQKILAPLGLTKGELIYVAKKDF